MESYTMLSDCKNQHCENDSTTQSNLQVQCNPYQTTNDLFHRTRTKKITICMGTQKTPNSQTNLEKENGVGGIRLPEFRLYYKTTVIKTVWYWHKKQKYRSMEQDRKPKVKPTHLCTPNL